MQRDEVHYLNMTMLTKLVESDEISELTVLSKGLKELVESCDFIVPDTSFVTHNLFGTSDYNRINRSLSKYAGEHNQINPFSLIDLYKDLSIDSGMKNQEEIDLDEIQDVLDQNLFVLDMTLDALIGLLLNGKIAVPSQANEELIAGHDACLKNIRIFNWTFRKIMANGYTSRMITE